MRGFWMVQELMGVGKVQVSFRQFRIKLDGALKLTDGF